MDDDFFGGDDLDFSTDDNSDYGDDFSDWGSSDSGSSAPSGGGSSSDTSYLDGLDQYGDGPGVTNDYNGVMGADPSTNLGSTSAGTGAGGFNWGSLVGPALGAANGYATSAAQQKLLSEKEKMDIKEYAAKQAIDESYYQAHGAQLSKALSGYGQFYQPTGQSPFAKMGQMNVQTLPFGQQQGQGLLNG